MLNPLIKLLLSFIVFIAHCKVTVYTCYVSFWALGMALHPEKVHPGYVIVAIATWMFVAITALILGQYIWLGRRGVKEFWYD